MIVDGNAPFRWFGSFWRLLGDFLIINRFAIKLHREVGNLAPGVA